MLKKIHILQLLTLLLLFGFFSCKEVGPNVDLGEGGEFTTFIASEVETPQQKNILLEEFTGVRCGNCPAGHVLIKDLQAQYPNLIVVGLHSKFLAAPYAPFEDFRIPEAQEIDAWLGPVTAKPAAAINRKIFQGETAHVYDRFKWSDYVAQAGGTTPVNIHINPNFNNTTRQLQLNVMAHYTAEVPQPNNLTVFIAEDKIPAAQLIVNQVDSGYLQPHVLRHVVTPIKGIAMVAERQPGRVFSKDFDITLPQHWNENNIEVIAFVTNNEGNNLEVLQVVKANLK